MRLNPKLIRMRLNPNVLIRELLRGSINHCNEVKICKNITIPFGRVPDYCINPFILN